MSYAIQAVSKLVISSTVKPLSCCIKGNNFLSNGLFTAMISLQRSSRPSGCYALSSSMMYVALNVNCNSTSSFFSKKKN